MSRHLLLLHSLPGKQGRPGPPDLQPHRLIGCIPSPTATFTCFSQTPLAGSSPQRQRRQLDPRARQSEFKGLLSSFTGEDDDGLLDVRFERRGKGGSSGSKEAGRKRR